MLRIWSLLGGKTNAEAHIRFADPAVRCRIAGIIHNSREADARAAGMISQAVAALIAPNR
ncbi:MAG TPA: hypothetical protein DCL63_13075 [Firmicutes bacterium]|nr:hypothetical protein [Bacillota bacterium]